MKYHNVCVDSFACTLPEEIVTTAELEDRLEPLYQRLQLPKGRLELMTGIQERRLWPKSSTIGQQSVRTVEKLLKTAQIDRRLIGALIHGSVCRDFLEPATVCAVHHALKLPDECLLYDISNACLGIATGMMSIANMIELGQIQAGIVVGTESSRALMEATIAHLNTATTLTRQSVKSAFASLTIGSGSAAVLLTHRSISKTQNRLLGGAIHSKTEFCHLCQSEGDASSPLMQTDSEALMHEGVRTAAACWERFQTATGWSPTDIDKAFCHQVGRRHQQLLFDTLGLDLGIHYPTLQTLGNTGSAAFPTAAALGIEAGFVQNGDRMALLAIGSGINVTMLGIQWEQTL